ncbi:MAG: MerR family transcriptional regulator [Limimaricola sp.]|uniref:MerR family transcriptional regulator n=1 Tax=Limimaricola sp. TaxID=2211665 RepID=UPI001D7D9B3B|nr:MerR family transcriptional regulator [Limimaricola sp.]MBI1418312.1 MerR family transcriptional regulator [Limimaricola sp.]
MASPPKSPDAFRTISEVADWLDTPAHVLRFWESKFSQIKPVKRAGGRRYYRPEDMALLGGIKTLLHDEGMTIKGVQKLLREQGVRSVAARGPDPLADAAAQAQNDATIEATPLAAEPDVAEPQAYTSVALPEPEPESASPIPFPRSARIVAAPRRLEAEGQPGRTHAGAMRAALAAIPADKAEDEYAQHGRNQLLFRADPVWMRHRADRIAPLAERLRAVRARMPARG